MEEAFPACPVIQDSGMVIRVESNAPGSIMSVIQQASPGTTIVIPTGEYVESLVIDREVTIVGEGDVTLSAAQGQDTVTLRAPHCVIRALKIGPGVSQSASPIRFLGGSASVEQCVIMSQFMPPVSVYNDGNLYFTSCSVTSDESAIMYVGNRVNVEFSACIVSSPHSIGIIATGTSQVRLTNQTRVMDCGDSGVIVMERASIMANQCIITKNGGDGIELTTASTTNYIVSSAIDGHAQGAGVSCSGTGALVVQGSRISDCSCGVFATGGFVVELNTCEVHDMEAALVSSVSKAAVTIKGGRLFGRCKVGVCSDKQGIVKCEAVTIESIETTGASVTGAGVLEVTQCVLQGIKQIGIEAHDGAVLRVSGCQMNGNEVGFLVQNEVTGFMKDTIIAKSAIVGVHFMDNRGDFFFENCQFIGSEMNGVHLRGTSVAFRSCELRENQGHGVEAKGAATSPQFSKCVISNNGSSPEEHGVCLYEGCSGAFDECVFENNTSSGVCMAECPNVKFSSCMFKTNRMGGVTATAATVADFTKCGFVQNVGSGAQVSQAGTKVNLTECHFHSQQGNGINVIEGGLVTMTQCDLQMNSEMNMNVQGGMATVTSCALSKSIKGYGMNVSHNGEVRVIASNLCDEAQTAIVVSGGGNCICEGCDISRCGTCGVYLSQGCRGVFKGNKVHDNGGAGFQVMDGSPSINENEVFNNGMYAISIGANADPQVVSNQFRDNGTMDVYRE